jgi:hypothetical protein
MSRTVAIAKARKIKCAVCGAYYPADTLFHSDSYVLLYLQALTPLTIHYSHKSKEPKRGTLAVIDVNLPPPPPSTPAPVNDIGPPKAKVSEHRMAAFTKRCVQKR